MRRAVVTVFTCALMTVLAAGETDGHSGHAGPVPIQLTGNGLQGNFAITPSTVPGMEVGEYARFTNADGFERHAVQEEHGVWSTGELAPKAEQLRLFEAGTHRFACTIHPQMRGEFAIPPQLYTDRLRDRKGKRRYQVAAIWSFEEPADGLVYDVERRKKGAAAWSPLRTGTTSPSIAFRGARRTTYQVRARVRRGDQATEWSPAASVRVP